MRRGVESTFTYSLSEDCDPTELKVVFEQFGNTILQMDYGRLVFNAADIPNLVALTLTSSETLKFASGMAHTQLVFSDADGNYKNASTVLGFYVKDTLGVEPYGIQN